MSCGLDDCDECEADQAMSEHHDEWASGQFTHDGEDDEAEHR
jgi:hypothetical protein